MLLCIFIHQVREKQNWRPIPSVAYQFGCLTEEAGSRVLSFQFMVLKIISYPVIIIPTKCCFQFHTKASDYALIMLFHEHFTLISRITEGRIPTLPLLHLFPRITSNRSHSPRWHRLEEKSPKTSTFWFLWGGKGNEHKKTPQKHQKKALPPTSSLVLMQRRKEHKDRLKLLEERHCRIATPLEQPSVHE